MSKALLYKVTIGALLITLGVVSIYIITPPSKTKAGFGSGSIDIFDSYGSWPSSTTLKSTDTMVQVLFQMRSDTRSSSVDINGDGLTDVLHHEYNGVSFQDAQGRFGVFLNKGNLTYDLVYKCYVRDYNSVRTYYGDCAG